MYSRPRVSSTTRTTSLAAHDEVQAAVVEALGHLDERGGAADLAGAVVVGVEQGELLAVLLAVGDQPPVALLEDVERHQLTRDEHHGEREESDLAGRHGVGTLVPRAPPTRPRRSATVRAGQAGGGRAARAGARADRQAGVERGAVRPVPGGARGDRAAGARSQPLPGAAAAPWPSGWPPVTASTADRIAVGNGADAIVGLLSMAYLDPGDEAVMGWPSFSSYRLATIKQAATPVRCRCATASTTSTRWPSGSARARASSTSATPNNPTGTMVGRAALRGVPRPRPRGRAGGRRRGLPRVRHRPGLSRTRSPSTCSSGRTWRRCARSRRSTAWPGCGSATWSARAAVVREAMKVRNPFDVSELAHVAALASLDDPAELRPPPRSERARPGGARGGARGGGDDAVPGRAPTSSPSRSATAARWRARSRPTA